MRVLSIAAALVFTTSTVGQEIVEIPPLAPDTNTHVLDISSDGSVVLGTSSSLYWRSPDQNFLWTKIAGTEAIPKHPDWPASWASSISGNGRVVVGASFDYQRDTGIAWRWTRDGGFEDLPLPPGAQSAAAIDVNFDGSVIIGRFVERKLATAFRWSEATGTVALPRFPDVEHHMAFYVNADGSAIAGIATNDDGRYAIMPFRWTQAEGMQALGHPPAQDGYVSVSALPQDGRTIVINYTSRTSAESTAYQWRADSRSYVAFAEIGFGFGSSDEDAYVRGGSSSNSVFVGIAGSGLVDEFFWTPALGIVDLGDFLSARGVRTLRWSVEDVSDDGTVLVLSNSQQPASVAILTNFTLPTDCPPDIDLNETLDTFDFLAFVNRFNAGDLRADLDGDGELTITDFIAFQAAFAAGC